MIVHMLYLKYGRKININIKYIKEIMRQMSNYNDYDKCRNWNSKDWPNDAYTNVNNLNVKIFSGLPKDVEKQIYDFINSKPINIDKILQSESSNNNDYSITITIFYYSEELSRFIEKNLTVEALGELIGDHIEGNLGIKLLDVYDYVMNKTGI